MDYYINLTYSFAIFIIGLMFGSFFTLATYRIPRHQDIIKTRSYCPNCKHKLGFFDCFPILSYVSTIGRCRYCKKKISIRYPLIELASGFVFLLIYLFFGLSWQSLILVACYIYLFLVIGIDIMKKNMTEEEIKEVERIKEENKKEDRIKIEKVKKKGAINVDIIIAVIIFTVFFASTITVTKNYSSTLIENKLKTDALNLCMNKLNEERFKGINEITTNSGEKEIDGINYSYSIVVAPFEDEKFSSIDGVKVITSTVSYVYSGEENSVSLKSLKVERS